MEVELNGRVALVTGAAQRNGKAIADELAENGVRDFYTDMNYDAALESASAWSQCARPRPHRKVVLQVD